MRRHQLATLVALAVAIAAVAAGCGDDKPSATTTVAAGVDTTPSDLIPGQSKPSVYNDASLFVLHEDDLPTGYLVDAGNTRAVTNRDSAKGRDESYLRQLESWGRITGYASGWRPGTPDVEGPLQVQSSASTFETVGGAVDAYALGIKEAEGTKLTRLELDAGVGDEARMWTTDVESDLGTLAVYQIAWRSGQVLAVVAVTSTKGTVTPGDAIEYAQLQQRRIETLAAKALGK